MDNPEEVGLFKTTLEKRIKQKRDLVIASWQKAKDSTMPFKDKVRKLIYVKEAIAINDYLTFDSLMIPKEKFDEVCLDVAAWLLKEVRKTRDYLKSMVLLDILKKMHLFDKVDISKEQLSELIEELKEKYDAEKEKREAERESRRGLF